MSTPAPRKATRGIRPAAFILTDHGMFRRCDLYSCPWGLCGTGTPACVRPLLFLSVFRASAVSFRFPITRDVGMHGDLSRPSA